ncbi:MAG: hypothetical protein F6K56_31720 [Moorea sp. SIO3G5]|nr:hypothetical protein [Moorena sp. SIO3G5]
MGETTPVAGGTAVAHGGNPQDRAASPRPHWLPKTALHRFLIHHFLENTSIYLYPSRPIYIDC